MKSCQELLCELRVKTHAKESQLRTEKKNLYKIQEFFTEEKEKWTAEIKEEEIKIHEKEEEIKEKTAKLEDLKEECDAMMKHCQHIEAENERLKKELEKTKKTLHDEQQKIDVEQGKLEKELNKVRKLQSDLKKSNKWLRLFQEKDLRAHEVDKNYEFKEELQTLTNEFAKKIELFDERLQEIDNASLAPREKRLRALKETLAHYANECKDVEDKITNMEKAIKQLDKL